ncbi:uncharacterized protein LOC131230993 [Magnolia sinica]|uniref:uncharacterized protein LOC131230993 n=1 Tax=Magnolia sinica TaxID=86752 RepID=UPI0026593B9C|nr:uncharacterized protein LOC131230993 [Magnolia sinica]
MSVAKLRTSFIPDAMKPEQKAAKAEKEGHDSLDTFIRQAIGKDPFLSFSRPGESPIQWIQLLQALDPQGGNKLSKGPKVDNAIEGKERPLEHGTGMSSFVSKMNGIKESVPSKKCSGVPIKGTQSTSEQMQTLKIPEAVVALAQAAAKANGEPDNVCQVSQAGLPGWPLLAPPKVQKCDKCSREFCSSINYRRHIRVHRRSLNIDKDSPTNRDFLGAFWDKLSSDEAREIVSFKSVTLEEVAGSSIIRALTSFIRKPGFCSLPQIYIKAGAALVDVVQAMPSRFPISSKELFSILDDASEKTFLCAGMAASMQKFVFDGEAGKIGLETKNLIACTSFLVEQKLVKAWLAEKDEEALRCEKQLVAEEEAAQKRQAELLERKRLKKLKQKEQKAKEQADREKADFKEGSPDGVEGAPYLSETSYPWSSSGSDSSTTEAPSDPVKLHLEPVQSLDVDVEACGPRHLRDGDISMDTVCGDTNLAGSDSVDARVWMQQQDSNQLLPAIAPQPVSLKLWRNTQNAYHLSHVQPSKPVVQKHNSYRDQRAVSSLASNGHKVWTRKTKLECVGEGSDIRVQRESRDPSDQGNSSQVVIGSISVRLGDPNSQDDVPAVALERCTGDLQILRPEKPMKTDPIQSGANRSTVKLWRPVSRQEFGGPTADHIDKREEAGLNEASGEVAVRALSDERSLAQCATGDDSSFRCKDSSTVSEGGDPTGLRLFSSHDAVAFFSQRWKEAMAGDHVELVLPSPETKPPDCLETLDGNHANPPSPSPLDGDQSTAPGNAENQFSGAPMGPIKSKHGAKVEKGRRLKYIPKQRSNA